MPIRNWLQCTGLQCTWLQWRPQRQRCDRKRGSCRGRWGFRLSAISGVLSLSLLVVVACASQLGTGETEPGIAPLVAERQPLVDGVMQVAQAPGVTGSGDRPTFSSPFSPTFSAAASGVVPDHDSAATPATPSEPLLRRALEPILPFDGDVQRLPPDLRRIVERGYLIVALPETDSFPFFYTAASGRSQSPTADVPASDRPLAGLDVQIARSLAAYLGTEVRFERNHPSFDAVVDRVFQGEADLAIAKLSLTLNRARQVRYSQPYVRLRPGLLFNRLALSRVIDFDLHRNPVDAIRQMGSTAELGVIQASAYARFARGAFPAATIREYPDWESVVDAIIHGRVLAGCRDELAIKHEILTRPNANVQMQSIVMDGWTDKIAVVLPWESGALREFVNHYLTQTDLFFTADQLLTQFLDVDSSLLPSP